MGGRGPAPKDPSKRARRNADPVPLRVITAAPIAQPALPTFYVEVQLPEGGTKRKKFVWHARTRVWWKMWRDSPLSADFTATDWSELLDTALLHTRFWFGDHKVAPELRLRVAKFGATPEDRARLRIQFAQASEADEQRSQPAGRSRHADLRLAE